MKNSKTLRLSLLTLIVSVAAFFSAQAQDWGQFGSVLSQLDSSKRADYLNRLNTLQNAGKFGAFDLTPAFDGLNNVGADPTQNLDGVLPDVGVVRDSLLTFLNGAGLASSDSLTLIGEFDFLSQVWSGNSGNLYQVYENNAGNFANAPTIPDSYYPTVTNATYQQGMDSLTLNQMATFGQTPASGLGNFDAAIGDLFDPQNFTRLEIYAGLQSSKATYYGLSYEVNLPVAGIRSVEQFNRTWEPRWRGQASWFTSAQSFSNGELTQSFNQNSPFMINGEFVVMYNPALLSGATSLRVITLLGADAAVYAPSYSTYNQPQTTNNRGFSTGWGPIVGGGLATTVGQTTVYGLGSISYGDVIAQPEYQATKYRYRASKIEAGINYNNQATLRYEIGISSNWAHDGNKGVRYHQITVGLPTTALFH